MSSELPQLFDPLHLVKQDARLSGSIEINDLPQLRKALASADGKLEVRLNFGRDDAGQSCIIGYLTGQVEMICQRCLQPLPIVLECPIALGIVQSEAEATRLPEHYEPLQYNGQPLKLNEWIEEEALLSLPFAPLHMNSQCGEEYRESGGIDAATAVGKRNWHRPFAGPLASLKNKSR